MRGLLVALGVLLFVSPALAATPCPGNGQPYNFKGMVLSTGVTADGRPFYAISATVCGDERHQIKAYPRTPVPACTIGRPVQASGLYNKSCVNSAAGPVCQAQIGLGSPYGAALTCN